MLSSIWNFVNCIISGRISTIPGNTNHPFCIWVLHLEGPQNDPTENWDYISVNIINKLDKTWQDLAFCLKDIWQQFLLTLTKSLCLHVWQFQTTPTSFLHDLIPASCCMAMYFLLGSGSVCFLYFLFTVVCFIFAWLNFRAFSFQDHSRYS